MTGDQTTAQSPEPRPHVRWNRSAETLAVTRSDLPARLAEVAGLPTPTGPLAEDLITQTLNILDAYVPIGAVKLANDLVEAATTLGYETIPPIPSQITSAQLRISNAIAGLAPAELHCAATQLGLRPTTMEWGVRITVVRERKWMTEQAAELLADVDFGDDIGYPGVDDPGDKYGALRSTVAAALHSLGTQQPIDWEPHHVEALRCAVAIHLAQVGDAFLQTSEWRKTV